MFVYGGKTDLFNSYSYTSAPTTSDLLRLPLSQPFDTATPPWELVNSSSTSQIPNVSWHTLSAFNYSSVLLFGGQPGTTSPIVTFDEADSACLLELSNSMQPTWYPDVSWVGEPVRRIFHTSVTCPSTGRIYIVGGQTADGSQHLFPAHYIFDPRTLTFSVTPSNNGPPALYGHASVIFPDGRMFVFGGIAEDTPIPLSDVWSLDTANKDSVWRKVPVNSSSLPQPRRAFAAVAIGQGKILIQGGSDADLQNNMNDGWILDTSKDPAVWTEVTELAQVGARRDHYAILSNGLVIFGFGLFSPRPDLLACLTFSLGYLDSGPAPAGVQIFDPSHNTYPLSYLPPSPSASITQTMPGPTATVSGTGAYPTGLVTSTSTGITQPGSVPTAEPGENVSDKKKSIIAIAVGTLFGVLGAAALGFFVFAYVRRRRRKNGGLFMVIEDDNDGNGGNLRGRPLMPAAIRHDEKEAPGMSGWANNLLDTAFGITGTARSHNPRHTHQRRDMLADEDTRDFGEWYNARRRDGTGGSSWSLMSVFGGRFRSRDASIFSYGSHHQERTDPFSDGISLIQDREPEPSHLEGKERSRHGGEVSYRTTSNYSYIDPFDDPFPEERQSENQQELSRNREDTDNGLATAATMISRPQITMSTLRMVSPLSMAAYPLSPLLEYTPNTIDSDHGQTTFSHTQSSGTLVGTNESLTTSQTSSEPFRSSSKPTIESPMSPKLLPFTSIVPANMSPSGIRRSDSWWSRFYRTSFLDRRSSSASHRSNILDIRDPNPPPPLVPIVESTSSVSGEEISLNSADDADGSRQISRSQSRVYKIGPGKSMTSLRTADTEQIEKLAVDMDVVQRVRTPSQTTSDSTNSGLGINACKLAGSDHNEQSELGVISSSPTERVLLSDTISHDSPPPAVHTSIVPVSPTLSLTSYQSPPSTPAPKPSVADRVKMYERRMSQDQERLSPTNTKNLEERSPNKERVTINYGLAPRANLFVANPDHRNSRSSDS